MDLNMPVLNGSEASAIIRKLNPYVPIVAMTADAITGVDEECKRVGIDHYISKPFDPEKLIDTLLHILNHQTESGNPEAGSTEDHSSGDAEILDTADGLRRIGNNMNLYQMILKEFMNEFRDASSELKHAIDAQDYKEAIQIVHKNKGGSGNIGAKKLSVIASELQKALLEGSNDKIEQLYAEFDSSIRKLFIEIEKKL